ncbi:MAG: disulfide bond formation protein B [Patescibacteria group bacterium]
MKKLLTFISNNAYTIVFAQAIVAMSGSLFYSEVMHLTPCVLCWYQRICMYPLVLLSGIAVWTDDKKAYRYIMPLALIGFAIALYHNLLYYNILPEAIAPCQLGVSCTTKYMSWLGFITIPLQSFVAFTIISKTMIIKWRQEKEAA